MNPRRPEGPDTPSATAVRPRSVWRLACVVTDAQIIGSDAVELVRDALSARIRESPCPFDRSFSSRFGHLTARIHADNPLAMRIIQRRFLLPATFAISTTVGFLVSPSVVWAAISCSFGICDCDTEASCNTMVSDYCTKDDFRATATNPSNGAATAGNCTGRPPRS